MCWKFLEYPFLLLLHKTIEQQNLLFVSKNSKVPAQFLVDMSLIKKIYVDWHAFEIDLLFTLKELISVPDSRVWHLALGAFDVESMPNICTNTPTKLNRKSMWPIVLFVIYVQCNQHGMTILGWHPRLIITTCNNKRTVESCFDAPEILLITKITNKLETGICWKLRNRGAKI